MSQVEGNQENMTKSDQELATGIRQLALDAGAAIMEIYNTDFEVRGKKDDSPVTEADEKGEEIIIAGLKRLAPEIPIIAEESVAAGKIPDISNSTQFWLVDPLDGTKEFINRNGEFTVNIALIRDGQPAIGVVYTPAKGWLFVGAGPGQATLEEDGGPAKTIQTRTIADDGMVAMVSRSHKSPETASYLDQHNVKDTKDAGSSLKFCVVARGEADIYPRLGRTMEWDIAAGHAVLACAGGKVTTIDGAPMQYGKPEFENPHFVAWGQNG
jgi:3'(2'), 5'-bisphosphate nucleotidase